MTREEFFSKLNARLSILNESERRDIIEEYQSHIDFKIQDGKSEAQAISDFGDIDELADEILQAYHIDNNATKSKNLEYYIKTCVRFVNEVTERLLSLSMQDIARIIVEFIVVLFAIWAVSIPFDIVSGAIRSTIFGFNLGGISNLLAGIVKLFFELISLAVAFLIVYSFIKTRVMTRMPQMPKYTQSPKKEKPQPQESFDFSQANFDVNTGKPLKHKTTLGDIGKSSSDFIVKTTVAVLKILLFLCVWLPGIFVTIGLIVATVLLCILMMTSSIGFWGLNLILAGCAVISIGVTAAVTDVIFPNNKKAGHTDEV
ncbi:MAG: DUF1700 domain-containing protein [Oscillospiraceae bacterium]|nr:DUF1700 domain-containing protein [Oscillospiraceae bacterium]